MPVELINAINAVAVTELKTDEEEAKAVEERKSEEDHEMKEETSTEDDRKAELESQSEEKNGKEKGDETKEGLVIWDYHVILVVKENPDSLVFDLDTRLPYPSSFKEYSRHTFSKHEEENMREQFHRKFRVIAIREFLENSSQSSIKILYLQGS